MTQEELESSGKTPWEKRIIAILSPYGGIFVNSKRLAFAQQLAKLIEGHEVETQASQCILRQQGEIEIGKANLERTEQALLTSSIKVRELTNACGARSRFIKEINELCSGLVHQMMHREEYASLAYDLELYKKKEGE